MMETKNKDFISYLDDDDTKKDKYVIIIKENEIGIEFKFDEEAEQIIFIPWNRVLKIKRRGQNVSN